MMDTTIASAKYVANIHLEVHLDANIKQVNRKKKVFLGVLLGIRRPGNLDSLDRNKVCHHMIRTHILGVLLGGNPLIDHF